MPGAAHRQRAGAEEEERRRGQHTEQPKSEDGPEQAATAAQRDHRRGDSAEQEHQVAGRALQKLLPAELVEWCRSSSASRSESSIRSDYLRSVVATCDGDLQLRLSCDSQKRPVVSYSHWQPPRSRLQLLEVDLN